MQVFFEIIIALTVTIYPIFIIIDAIRRHRKGERFGKRVLIELGIGILVFFVSAVIIGYANSDNSSNTVTVAHKKKNTSKNLPGRKINSSNTTKHEFYWTSKDDKKVRYFVDDDKKITAIKVVLNPDINNTWWCQSYMEKVLHDDNLKYGIDKQGKNDAVLSNHVKYNIYSPKYKKWYWVNFEAADGKNMVASFSIYPGKNKDAE